MDNALHVLNAIALLAALSAGLFGACGIVWLLRDLLTKDEDPQ